MDADAIIQGGGLILSGAAVAKAGDWLMAWLRLRHQKTTIEPMPLPVDKLDKFVTRGEFNKHVELNEAAHKAIVDDNARDHESLFGRMSRNDRETSELKGILSGIREDLSAIKNKLFKIR